MPARGPDLVPRVSFPQLTQTYHSAREHSDSRGYSPQVSPWPAASVFVCPSGLMPGVLSGHRWPQDTWGLGAWLSLCSTVER